jgi:hypothetical protein
MLGNDICIHLGTLSIGATTKGYIWVDIEYLPCENGNISEILLRDCFHHIVQPAPTANALFFVPSSSTMRLSRGGQYIELLRKENLL